ncbi:MAG: uroporphyrinogen decarboxylase family protein [Verrucomicrobiota bacterium]|nr:uroporphyrinogen decarboxylase family protein [Verrucomicrobiota bacterium]
MTSKERMLRALNREKPDRVPATAHQWQGFHLKKYLNGMTDLEAFKKFSLDAAISVFFPHFSEDSEWIETIEEMDSPEDERRYRHTVITPEGKLEKLMGSNDYTCWNITHFIKKHEDIELLRKYLKPPILDHQNISEAYDQVGDDGIVRGFIFGDQGGCWQQATCMMGTQEMIYECADNPEWVHEFLRILCDKKLEFIHNELKGAKFDLIETGGGAASSTVISPKFFKEFCIPYDTELHDALHEVGHKVVYHTCGGMMPILDMVVENHCDASETLTPPSMGGDARPRELKAKIGDKVCLIGGLDQNSVLERSGRKEIFDHVKETFAAYGPNGGYMMSPSDHFFHMSTENLQAYSDAAKECVY